MSAVESTKTDVLLFLQSFSRAEVTALLLGQLQLDVSILVVDFLGLGLPLSPQSLCLPRRTIFGLWEVAF